MKEVPIGKAPNGSMDCIVAGSFGANSVPGHPRKLAQGGAIPANPKFQKKGSPFVGAGRIAGKAECPRNFALIY